MVVVERDGAVRAYPVRILDFHEIVNDRIGDCSIAVTWCPLCGAGVVYDRAVPGTAVVAFAWQDDHGPDAFWSQ